MAFTLYREKNGQRVPIKVSVLDVFRDPPRPKPRMTMKTQTNQPLNEMPFMANTTAKMVAARALDAATPPGYNNNAPASMLNQHPTFTLASWTEEDDAKLIEMKQTNKSWNEIKAVFRKDLKPVQQRWKMLQPQITQEPNNASKDEEDRKKAEERRAIAEKKKAEGLAKANHKRNKKNEPDQNQNQNNENEHKAELIGKNLASFAAQYEKDKWLALASKHYDQTGQRISAQQAKEKYEGK